MTRESELTLARIFASQLGATPEYGATFRVNVSSCSFGLAVDAKMSRSNYFGVRIFNFYDSFAIGSAVEPNCKFKVSCGIT